MSNTINYPGDCTRFDPERILGPDLHGAYDQELDRTVMRLRPIPPKELAQLVEDDKGRTFDKLDAIGRIGELFGGGA